MICFHKKKCNDYLCHNARTCLYDDIKDFSNKTKREKKHSKKVADLIKRGSRAECICCGRVKKLTFDHVVPLSRGGKDTLDNGQILCERCNIVKDSYIISLKFLRKVISSKVHLKEEKLIAYQKITIERNEVPNYR